MGSVCRQSVLTKVQLIGHFAAEWIGQEALAALWAEIEAKALANALVDVLVRKVVHLADDLVEIFQMIAILFRLIEQHEVDGSEDLKLDHVTKFVFGIEWSLAEVTRVVKHC